MSTFELWLTIVALSLVTLATRVSMLFLPAHVALPARLQRALRYAGPCILMAIVVPDLLRHDGAIDLGIDNIRLMAALVAVAVFLATRSAAIMIATGLLALTPAALCSLVRDPTIYARRTRGTSPRGRFGNSCASCASGSCR